EFLELRISLVRFLSQPNLHLRFAVVNELKLGSTQDHFFLLHLFNDCKDRAMKFLTQVSLRLQQLSSFRTHFRLNGRHHRRRVRWHRQRLSTVLLLNDEAPIRPVEAERQRSSPWRSSI